MGLALMGFGLSACDPGHPFDNVQIKIFSAGDGRATISASAHSDSVDVPHVDQAAFLNALADELAIGEIAGPASVSPDPNSSAPAVELEGVSRELLTVTLDRVLIVMDRFGLKSDASVFVSVCTSAATGTASGTGVDVVHASSCATWEPSPRPTTTEATATLRFHRRSTPSVGSIQLAALVAAFGIGCAIVFFVSAGPYRPFGLGGAILTVVASLVIAAAAFISGVRFHDTWLDTGQTFDQQLTGYRAASVTALLAGVAGPLLILFAGGVAHRRAKATGSDRDG